MDIFQETGRWRHATQIRTLYWVRQCSKHARSTSWFTTLRIKSAISRNGPTIFASIEVAHTKAKSRRCFVSWNLPDICTHPFISREARLPFNRSWCERQAIRLEFYNKTTHETRSSEVRGMKPCTRGDRKGYSHRGNTHQACSKVKSSKTCL